MFALQPFPAYPACPSSMRMIGLPEALPPPVARFLKLTMGEQVPVITSAVISGRGKIRFKGITFPARWRFVYQAGESYRHYIEVTLLGHPIMKVNEWYVDGHARLELPFGIVENEPKVDDSANLSLWAESIWLPSIFLTDSRVRWEPVSEHFARLIVPFGDAEESFTVSFDPETGLLKDLETMRYRDAADTQKIGWHNEIISWTKFQGIRLPSEANVRWADESTPWFVLSVDEVVYNVEVSDYLRGHQL
jgi:hypothetical protein